VKKKKRQHDVEAVNLSDEGEGDCSKSADFSVVLCRPNFMLVSEEHPMKTHTTQWLLSPLSPLALPWRATHQGPPPSA
jgi:hypothetical protein